MNFIKFHSEKNFIISGVCLVRSLSFRSLSFRSLSFRSLSFRSLSRHRTIDGNEEFVHSQLYSYVTSVVNLVFVSDKIINNSDNFGIQSFSCGIISAILCSLFSVFKLLYLIFGNISTNIGNFVFLVIFDICAVVYNWFISLLPPLNLYLIIYQIIPNKVMT